MATVKVGLLLPQPAEQFGEWLADATAFESAGADALWIDPGPALDPIVLTAALAALTYRSLLVVALPDKDARPLALATIKRLSRGRLGLIAGPDQGTEDAALDLGLAIFRPAESGAFERGPGTEGPAEEHERWVTVPPPEGRAAWRATLADAAERDVQALLVPADPRLLDILRNPDDPGDRHDLQLAQG